MSLLIAFVRMALVLGFVLLTNFLTPTYIRGMSLFIAKMKVDLVFLPLSLLSYVLFGDSPSVMVNPSPEVSLLDLGDFSSCSKCLMASLDLLKLSTISFSLLKSFYNYSFCIFSVEISMSLTFIS